MNPIKLQEITAEKMMSSNLTVVKEMEKISTAEILMIKKNVGGLPVVRNENELIGIITQRDIQLSHSIIGSAAFHVMDLMSKNPITCQLEDTLPVIVQKMVDNNIERIPIVTPNNRVVGIIVNKDIIQTLAKNLKLP